MTETRSKWPAADHLHQAADKLRESATEMPPDVRDFPNPVADWLDKSALDMAWLAPFRQHEGGYLPWQIATRVAHGILNLSYADTCATCHTHARDRKAGQS